MTVRDKRDYHSFSKYMCLLHTQPFSTLVVSLFVRLVLIFIEVKIKSWKPDTTKAKQVRTTAIMTLRQKYTLWLAFANDRDIVTCSFVLRGGFPWYITYCACCARVCVYGITLCSVCKHAHPLALSGACNFVRRRDVTWRCVEALSHCAFGHSPPAYVTKH